MHNELTVIMEMRFKISKKSFNILNRLITSSCLYNFQLIVQPAKYRFVFSCLQNQDHCIMCDVNVTTLCT